MQRRASSTSCSLRRAPRRGERCSRALDQQQYNACNAAAFNACKPWPDTGWALSDRMAKEDVCWSLTLPGWLHAAVALGKCTAVLLFASGSCPPGIACIRRSINTQALLCAARCKQARQVHPCSTTPLNAHPKLHHRTPLAPQLQHQGAVPQDCRRAARHGGAQHSQAGAGHASAGWLAPSLEGVWLKQLHGRDAHATAKQVGGVSGFCAARVQNAQQGLEGRGITRALDSLIEHRPNPSAAAFGPTDSLLPLFYLNAGGPCGH